MIIFKVHLYLYLYMKAAFEIAWKLLATFYTSSQSCSEKIVGQGSLLFSTRYRVKGTQLGGKLTWLGHFWVFFLSLHSTFKLSWWLINGCTSTQCQLERDRVVKRWSILAISFAPLHFVVCDVSQVFVSISSSFLSSIQLFESVQIPWKFNDNTMLVKVCFVNIRCAFLKNKHRKLTNYQQWTPQLSIGLIVVNHMVSLDLLQSKALLDPS